MDGCTHPDARLRRCTTRRSEHFGAVALAGEILQGLDAHLWPHMQRPAEDAMKLVRQQCVRNSTVIPRPERRVRLSVERQKMRGMGDALSNSLSQRFGAHA